MVSASTTCCRKDGQTCICASQARCSCGEKLALQCSCARASTENSVTGPRCSCRARPAGACTCERASIENATPTGPLCECGSRPADSCSCERANEIDFTTRR